MDKRDSAALTAALNIMGAIPMITDLEKFRRAKVLDSARRQSEADIAKQRREGVPAVTRAGRSADPTVPQNGANEGGPDV